MFQRHNTAPAGAPRTASPTLPWPNLHIEQRGQQMSDLESPPERPAQRHGNKDRYGNDYERELYGDSDYERGYDSHRDEYDREYDSQR